MQKIKGHLLFIATVALCLLLVNNVNGQIRRIRKDCSEGRACFPWNFDTGPFCGRGNDINIRFTLDIAPENYYTAYEKETMQSVTYGFCPRVDELQAFNLTDSGRLAGVAGESSAGMLNFTLSPRMYQSYLSLFGFGARDNVLFPNKTTSDGVVLVVDNSTNLCPLGQLAIAKFLILNVTMGEGKFVYNHDMNQPIGTGFEPTCDLNDICIFDSALSCIGPSGKRNCAKCYSNPEEVANMAIQIWTSYYGTDRFGRLLRSGSNNPMNFRAYSGTGVYSSVSTSVDKLESGKLATDDESLEP